MNQVIDTHTPNSLPQPVRDLISEGGRALKSDDEQIVKRHQWKDDIEQLAKDVRAKLMAKYSITFNGRHYETAGYRYDFLADAVVYAKLRKSRGRLDSRMAQASENVETPTEPQRRLMNELSITYQGGLYRFGAYRYERLIDALDYAKLH